MSAELEIARAPMVTGAFNTRAIANRMTAAISTRIARKIKGSAYGSPYLAPTKPVLHNKTKRSGATLESFNPRK